ncbi:tetratricopeptide repeat protein [Anaeromicropila herbilytica]|uniref:Tetratricopeptide repeat protein n=1 Tax=Anaeromicropila herbilytica TaxID=2785025 RepID=A0A7R7ID12_9FIRM|nr:tetratricopeptide repeat protein [Anaeromicropila herbilytica]BCN30529.1 hypothetical protein bsdtb5_18240 [Anaeromicropila herbilytica]
MQTALDMYIKEYHNLNEYVDTIGRVPARCYNIGSIYYFLGDIEKAKEYFERMCSSRKCDFCTTMECYEALIGKALLLEYQKEYRKAEEYYKKVLTYDVNNAFSQHALKRLAKMK